MPGGGSITWLKDGTLLSARNSLNTSLPLAGVRQEDAGLYTCQVVTDLGKVEASAILQVERALSYKLTSALQVRQGTRITSAPYQGEVLEGGQVKLGCEVR